MPTENASYSGPDTRYLAEFNIVESRNGWFRISNVRIIAIRDASYDAYIVNISGWIEASAIRFNIQSSVGFENPDNQSARRIGSASWVMSSWRVLHNCNGKWVDVEIAPEDLDEDLPRTGVPSVRAWFRGVCGRSMIGCDEVTGD